MATTTKRAKRVRTAAEFNPVKLAEAMKPPRFTGAAYAWDLEAIRAARQQQMEGNFQLPSKLAEAQKSDDGIFTALRNRLSPARGLPVGLIPANATAKAVRVKEEAEALYGIKGVGCHPGAFSDINECVADHGVAFGVNVLTPRADGSRVDIEHTYWPIEHVYWDRTTRAFVTRLDNGSLETICHGDGRWTIYTQHSSRPWRWGALLSTALIWADRQFGVRDRSRASTSHGNAKMIGELPEGVAIDSPEGEAFLMLLRTMHEALPYGIRPAGSKTEMMVNQSASWQIFKEIVDSRLSDAARVYLGHDGSIRAAGGNYIKDGYLFGVSADIVEADLRTMERGFFEGVLQPWTALNFGDSSLAPMRRWLMPDADEETRIESATKRRESLYKAISDARAAGLVVDQAYVDQIARELGVSGVTVANVTTSDRANAISAAAKAIDDANRTLATYGVQVDGLEIAARYGIPTVSLGPDTGDKAPSIALAPTDIAKVVTVNEARASAGLGALMLSTGAPDPLGLLTVDEFSQKKAAEAAAEAAIAEAAPVSPGAVTPAAPQELTADPNEADVAMSEAPTDESAANLAAKMTEAALERCEHQRSNRCWMCGIERVRDFDVVDGVPTWRVAWRPIGEVTAASPKTLE